jgi:hypothetical protein
MLPTFLYAEFSPLQQVKTADNLVRRGWPVNGDNAGESIEIVLHHDPRPVADLSVTSSSRPYCTLGTVLLGRVANLSMEDGLLLLFRRQGMLA